jgi:hypothetical protein
MARRKPGSLDNESRDSLGLLRRLREIFELEIQDLESSGPSPHAALRPAKGHDSSLHERRYERLLRLRRIRAKLYNRERVLSENATLGQE